MFSLKMSRVFWNTTILKGQRERCIPCSRSVPLQFALAVCTVLGQFSIILLKFAPADKQNTIIIISECYFCYFSQESQICLQYWPSVELEKKRRYFDSGNCHSASFLEAGRGNLPSCSCRMESKWRGRISLPCLCLLAHGVSGFLHMFILS